MEVAAAPDVARRALARAHGRVPAAGRPLRIAMLAPPWIPVPPRGYGGIEAVVALLCEALVARGHDVELFCAPGSRSSAKVRTVLDAPHPDSIQRSLYEADHVARTFAAVEERGATASPFDVLHDHCGFTALAMADRLPTPVVHTVHSPFDADTTAFYREHRRKADLVCLSRAQARRAPSPAPAVVPNPIDAGRPTRPRKRDHLLWIGRMTPEKGPHRAVQAARMAGRQLILAGPVQPGSEGFFRAAVAPHIDGGMIRYVGEVSAAHKHRLFAEAAALLMPIRWEEPFGMVMVEALAAGTPVVAFPHGSAPEIVQNGETGFVVQDEREMAAAIARLGDLDPRLCRTAVAERWAPAQVAQQYEDVYRRAAGRDGHAEGDVVALAQPAA